MTFALRDKDPSHPEQMIYIHQNSSADLHVQGITYSRDMITWDNETESFKSLDELYVRRMGVTIPANQIEPGPFAPGYYTFQSNLSIAGAIDPDCQLIVHGDACITQDLSIQGTTTMNQLVAEDAILLDIASFCNDVYVNRDMIVNQSVRIRGQVFVEVLCNVSESNTSNYVWQAIQFSPAQASYSNINIMGQGISTPGRLGVGIRPTNDEVNHQMSIFKEDPYARVFRNMFELELYDRSSSKCRKGAYIGHPEPDSAREADGSLVFATPSATDINFAGIYDRLPQNFYFFPGTDMSASAPAIVRPDNVPTCGIFYNKRVGILTYSPRTTLDVRGSITFSG
ncbi:hypothetical protein EBT31_22795, partial [bacterium]|nr:hypothetical protein [bacterium]